MRKTAILTVAFGVCAGPAAAQIIDGNRIFNACEAADKTSVDYFIAGVADTAISDKAAVLSKSLQFSVNTTPIPAELTKSILKEMRSFCLSEPVDPQQLREAVCGYLKKNPGLRSTSAAKLAAEALRSAFPCRSG